MARGGTRKGRREATYSYLMTHRSGDETQGTVCEVRTPPGSASDEAKAVDGDAAEEPVQAGRDPRSIRVPKPAPRRSQDHDPPPDEGVTLDKAGGGA